MSATIIAAARFNDAGAFSRALSQSNVVCMQTTPGGLEFELTIVSLPDLELHLTTMATGGCIALGDTSAESMSFHVPLSNEGSLSLLGVPADVTGFAAYARGSELAVQARSGARLAYLVPNSGYMLDLCRIFYDDQDPERARTSRHITAEAFELDQLQALLNEISQIIELSPSALNNSAIAKNLQQSVLGQLFALAGRHNTSREALGRTERRYAQIVKTVHDYLHQFPCESIFVLDLCRALGISQPTLFRAFRRTLGMGPKEYLQIRRLHLSRQRLLHDPDPAISVQAVAYDLGFWHLGRFGSAYRTLFGEMPSKTLRRSGNKQLTK